MSRVILPRQRRAVLGAALVALATAICGCSGGESGIAPSVPTKPEDTAALKKSGRAPRVPRGPDMAKALQDQSQGK